MTVDEIRALLAEKGPQAPCGDLIACGNVDSADGQSGNYEIRVGWDGASANVCDLEWGRFNISIFEHVANLKLEPAACDKYVADLQLEDSHWNWLQKALGTINETNYKWFFMFAGGRPQAAALIYHPKPSAVDEQGIYYVEFIAVAPWNRGNPIAPKRLSGVGRVTLRHINEYCQKNLGLRPGFSLHSLPKAEVFYRALGMTAFPAYDKGVLKYFEMLEPAIV